MRSKLVVFGVLFPGRLVWEAICARNNLFESFLRWNFVARSYCTTACIDGFLYLRPLQKNLEIRKKSKKWGINPKKSWRNPKKNQLFVAKLCCKILLHRTHWWTTSPPATPKKAEIKKILNLFCNFFIKQILSKSRSMFRKCWRGPQRRLIFDVVKI